MEPDAQRLHRISLAQLQDAPGWNQVWIQTQALLSGRRVGVYNAEFDLRMMRQSNQKNWLPWTVPEQDFTCIMKLYARFHGEWDVRRSAFRYQSLIPPGNSAASACQTRIQSTTPS
jgi:DNA polymerase-3 subunit epsilon